MPLIPENRVDEITDNLMKALLKAQNLVFVHLPGVNSNTWPDHIRRQFYRDVDQTQPWKNKPPERDWIFLELTGTTFSGHSTKTTLGNTLRTLCYAWYYQQQAGISDTPWSSDLVFSIASGDDCVMFVEPDYAQRLHDTILALSARNTDEQVVGLGQCIKEIDTGRFFEIEFCSKWSFSPDGTLDSWQMCRSAKKLMTTRQYFTGSNQHILKYPYLHRKAILQGFESEQVSRLIEDMLTIQLQALPRPNISERAVQERIRLTKQIAYANAPSGYAIEAYVNQRMGYSIANLWLLRQREEIYAGRSRPEPDHIMNKSQIVHRSKMDHEKSLLKKEEHKVKELVKKAETKVQQQQAQLKKRKAAEQVTRPNFSKGVLQQKTNVNEVLTAWDEMMVAKNFPGMQNVAYAAGMNVCNLPTNTFSVSNTFADGNHYGEVDDSPLGTASYTLIMWSSSMTAFFGDNQTGSIPATDKLGGLVIKMVDPQYIDDAWIVRGLFTEAQSAYTMLETYGSDMTGFSAGGFVWASEATFNILAPAANMVGSYFRGTLQYGQLPNTPGTALSLRQLLEIAGDAEVMKPQFHMRTGVVNHNIVYESQQFKGDGLVDNEFVGELVNYVILQDVARDIGTGDLTKFSLQMNVKGNGVFWGKPSDSIANNLFKTADTKKSPLPGMLAGVQQNPDMVVKNKPKTLFEGAKHLLSKAWDNRNFIMTAAQTLAPMLLAEKADSDPIAVKVNYIATLNQAYSALVALSQQNPYLDIKLLDKVILDERERVRHLPGRIIPLVPMDLEIPQASNRLEPQNTSTPRSVCSKKK